MPDQPELRQRLIDAMEPWQYEPWGNHMVDVLLALPGIAIVQLPATFINQTKVEKVLVELKWIHKQLEEARQWRDWDEVARLRTRVSRAAALLAAAGVAEEQHG